MLTIPKEFLDAFREECRQASDEQLAASLSQFEPRDIAFKGDPLVTMVLVEEEL